VGRPANPWRVIEARHRRQSSQRREIPGSPSTATVAIVANVLDESCSPDHGGGFLRRADGHWPLVVRPRHARACPPTRGARGGHASSDRRLDDATTSRSLSMGQSAALPDSRSGSRVCRSRRHGASDGHHRSADRATVAVAKRRNRAIHRIGAPGVPRSRDRLERCWLTAPVEMVRRELRRVTDALGTGEGRAGVAGRRSSDRRQNHRRSAGRRSPSSIRTRRSVVSFLLSFARGDTPAICVRRGTVREDGSPAAQIHYPVDPISLSISTSWGSIYRNGFFSSDSVVRGAGASTCGHRHDHYEHGKRSGATHPAHDAHGRRLPADPRAVVVCLVRIARRR